MGLTFSDIPQIINKELTMYDNETIETFLNFTFSEEDFDYTNGLHFNGIYLPEEVATQIISYIPKNEILKLRLVCKKWYNIIKSSTLWNIMYHRQYGKSKLLPWYVYHTVFENSGNLLRNNCGQSEFEHWKILHNGGNKFKIEKKPIGCEPYDSTCPDFNNCESCFATSFGSCCKLQNVPLAGNLLRYVVNKHKPHIYASEWVAGRFDCGGTYKMSISLYSKDDNPPFEDDASDEDDYQENSNITDRFFAASENKEFAFGGNEATKWTKIEVTLKDYFQDIKGITFQHYGKDNQFWAGHYGPKMAGGVVKILFDTIESLQEECLDTTQ